jgi:transposase InsO family protein
VAGGAGPDAAGDAEPARDDAAGRAAADHPGRYPDRLLRSLQRRVAHWRATEGPERELIFRQEHPPGLQALSDFTDGSGLDVMLGGEPFAHLLYHFWLAYSGWQYVKAICGGESFTALTEGLQEALWQLGGVPREHRTDRLSAAYRNLATADDEAARYAEFCRHYDIEPSRNNAGVSHENGSVEAAHGHLKAGLGEALELRGSRDFADLAAYQTFLQEFIARKNARRRDAAVRRRSPTILPPCSTPAARPIWKRRGRRSCRRPDCHSCRDGAGARSGRLRCVAARAGPRTGRMTDVDAAKLPVMLNTLRLPTIGRLWQEFGARADREGWGSARFLAALCEHELADRATRRIARHMAESGLPHGKTFATFDFAAVPTIRKAHVMALAAGDTWLEQSGNLLIFVGSGTGKTHLAAAIGTALVDNGRGYCSAAPPIWCKSYKQRGAISRCRQSSPSSTVTRCWYWTISATSARTKPRLASSSS